MTLPAALQRMVDERCDEFEAQCRRGKLPEIEHYLDRVPQEARDVLLGELLHLELAFYKAQGSLPPVDPYLARFPDFSAAVHRVFSQPVASLHDLKGMSPEAATGPIPEVARGNASDSVGATVAMSTTLKILRPHARGGLGEVSVAWDDSLRREIAFKEMHPQVATHDETRKRFLREAEITGRLEHPGIVPLYGLGQFPDGRPFYAMRFIHGPNLKDAIERLHAAGQHAAFVRERWFELRELLGRFLDLCDAIGYAHSRGIIHRDLKPGNVMLGDYGETLVVDWGLAKPLQSPDDSGGLMYSPVATGLAAGSTVRVLNTQLGRVVGTPQFMSPEQAAGQVAELGPAADIYSLGATLYTLLTGRPPIERGTQEAMLADVRNGKWPRPRIVHSGVPRPLESICTRAMALRPEDRYRTTLALADDLRHWLADEPVVAHRESFSEQLVRMERRHRGIIRSLGIGLAVLALVSSAFAVALNFQRQAAIQAAAAEAVARKDAEASNVQKELVLNFLLKTFRSPDPSHDGRKVTVASVLDRAREQLSDMKASPVDRSTLQSTLGETYFGLGLYHDAHELLEQAVKIRSDLKAPETKESINIKSNLGTSLGATGQTDKAVEILEQVLAWRIANLGPGHIDTIWSQNNLAAALRQKGDLPRAIRLWETALSEMKAAKFSPQDRLTIQSGMAVAYRDGRQFDKAVPLMQEIVEQSRKQFGPEHPTTLVAENNLGDALLELGQIPPALELLEHAVESARLKLGEDHPETLRYATNLGDAYRLSGEPAKAIPLLEQGLAGREEALGTNHPLTMQSRNNLAAACYAVGRLDDAIPLFETVFEFRRKTMGERHPETLNVMNNLGAAWLDAGRVNEATPLLEKTLTLTTELLGDANPQTLSSQNKLGRAYLEARRYDEAVALLRQCHQGMTATFGDKNPNTLTVGHNLARALSAAGDSETAAQYFESVYRERLTQFGDSHPDTLDSQVRLALEWIHEDRAEESKVLLEQAAAQLQQLEPKLSAAQRVSLRQAIRAARDYFKETEDPQQSRNWESLEARFL